MSNQEHCEILGIASDATSEQIEKAYCEKAKMYHPDINKLVVLKKK